MDLQRWRGERRLVGGDIRSRGTLASESDCLPARCDVLVVGAGLAGASFALLLRRQLPSARVTMIEADPRRPRLGSFELSGSGAAFFAGTLGLAVELAHEHLPAHGTRCWFGGRPGDALEQMSEVNLPLNCTNRAYCGDRAYHVDGATLLEELRRRARAAGVTLVRGARAEALEFTWPESSVRIEDQGTTRELRTRWIVDASGERTWSARWLGRPSAGIERAGAHYVATWTGTLDFEGDETLSSTAQRRDPHVSPPRSLCTLHFGGPGWGATLTPHPRGGATLALHLDRQRERLPDDLPQIEGYGSFVRGRPGLARILRDAHLDPASFRASYPNAWSTTSAFEVGRCALGAAAEHIDPLFGDPLGELARHVWSASHWIAQDLLGAVDRARLERVLAVLDARVRRRRREVPGRGDCALYGLLGDASSMAILRGIEGGLRRWLPSDDLDSQRGSTDCAEFEARVCAWIRRRMLTLAERRRSAGLYGDRNQSWHPGAAGGRPERSYLPAFARAVGQWARLEYGCFRERLTPVVDDQLGSSTSHIARLAGALEERLATAAKSPAE